MVRSLMFFIFLANSSIVFSQYYPVDTIRLNTAYRELKKNPNSLERQKNFFHAFPSTWMEYIMTYQFMGSTWPYFKDRDSKGYDLTLYRLSSEHNAAFEKMLPLIPDTLYCTKLINLCIGGRWDADAVSGLQEIAQKVMSKKTQIMFNRLSEKTRGSQLRFWMFYWSSLHLVNSNVTQCKLLKNKFGRSMPDQVKIMEIGFEFATEEFYLHGPYEDYPHMRFKGKDHPYYYFD